MNAGGKKGDILKQSSFDVAEEETTFTLNAKCYEAALDSFTELVDELASDRVEIHHYDIADRVISPNAIDLLQRVLFLGKSEPTNSMHWSGLWILTHFPPTRTTENRKRHPGNGSN